MTDLSFLKDAARQINDGLDAMMADRAQVVPKHLWQAMRYSLLAGGKRVRPALMMECYTACGGTDVQSVLPAALSVECLHTYSLIHDDLPCMDDDDLRRGMPTCHKEFDEATAILAADALQTLSFELIAELDVSPELQMKLIKSLALASGAQGMVGGQVLDMQAEADGVEGLLEVERIHLHKTGALLRYACETGALLAGANQAHNQEQFDACSRYGKAVGLLFQIADDILDATATSDELGKSAGKDAAQNKATYVSILGLQQARELSAEMRDLALEACKPLGQQGESLQALAHYIFGRKQ